MAQREADKRRTSPPKADRSWEKMKLIEAVSASYQNRRFLSRQLVRRRREVDKLNRLKMSISYILMF